MEKPDPFRRARRSKRRDTADSLEIDRIVRLPIVYEPTDEEVDAFCADEVQAQFYDEGFRLFPTQVGGVLAWDLYKGLFAPIGVGWGKTLITLMIANRAFTEGDSQRSMIFVPPQVYPQLTRTDIPWARKRVGLRVPFILMGGRSLAERRAIARSGKVGCYVLPYSYLSTRDTEEMLEGIRPDLMILDEAHAVKNPRAARTRRLMSYLRDHQPRLVALSGTITSKSINDYHHLLAFALRQRCPLPIESALALNWSYVIDAGADPSDAQTGPITPLISWARKHFPDIELPAGVPGFREAYKLRLVHSPGVVSTGDKEIGVSLAIENLPVPMDRRRDEGYAKMVELMKRVDEMWLTPSGDEIDHGFHKWRYLYELTAGFFYRLRWPEVEELVLKGRTVEQAEDALERALEHHEAKQEFNRTLRRWIEWRAQPGLDTPFLVTGDMARNGAQNVGPGLYNAWQDMKRLEFEGMPERISEPVRVCSYKIDWAVKWAEGLKKEGGIVWFHHREVGEWLWEAMQEAGIDVVYCPSESHRKGSNANILDPKNANKIIVASMRGHGTGKNLQHFQRQLFVQFPRDATLIEQVLGRMHRNGQEADELVAHTVNSIEFDHANMSACIVDALYMHQTTGARQKLIYASYVTLPPIYPDDFLRERGFTDVSKLDKKQRAILEEKFGSFVGM